MATHSTLVLVERVGQRIDILKVEEERLLRAQEVLGRLDRARSTARVEVFPDLDAALRAAHEVGR